MLDHCHVLAYHLSEALLRRLDHFFHGTYLRLIKHPFDCNIVFDFLAIEDGLEEFGSRL